MHLASPHIQRILTRPLYKVSNREIVSSPFLSHIWLKKSTHIASQKRSSSSTMQPDGPAKPRLSSSLLLLNSKNEILMIQRTNESRTFAGMHAFPGGNHDESQDGKDMRMTAIREVFEETGLLLASSTRKGSTLISPSELSQARKGIHSRVDPLSFPSFLASNHLSMAPIIDYLIPFTQWITPTNAKSRFLTRFYVAFLEEMGDAVHVAEEIKPAISGSVGEEPVPTNHGSVAQIPVPTHDNHVEIQSAFFQAPREILRSFDEGAISLMPPQYYLLSTLSDILEKSETNPDLSVPQYVRQTVGKAFGARVFNPKFGTRTVGNDGLSRAVLMYEGDDQYEGASSGDTVGAENVRRHRSLVTFKDGRPASIQLERTIDVFNPSSGISSKL